MQLISTTATAVEKIKLRAKAIKKAEKLPHMEALELAAKNAGYESWYHVGYCFEHQGHDAALLRAAAPHLVMNAIVADLQTYMGHLSNKGSAAATSNPLKGNVFHDIALEGMHFQGGIGIDGPCLMNVSVNNPENERFVQLGVAEIHYCRHQELGRDAGWWITKYGPDEPRINISSLTEKGRHSLAFEFGIPLFPRSEAGSKEESDQFRLVANKSAVLFYLSPAFESLRKWAQSHRRKVRSKNFGDAYLKGWKDAAIKGESPDASRLVNELLKGVSFDKENPPD